MSKVLVIEDDLKTAPEIAAALGDHASMSNAPITAATGC